MASIMIRDLGATKTLDRQASLQVKGGRYGGYLKPFQSPIVLDQKITPQIQVAIINNTAIGLGDLQSFDLSGIIGQDQGA